MSKSERKGDVRKLKEDKGEKRKKRKETINKDDSTEKEDITMATEEISAASSKSKNEKKLKKRKREEVPENESSESIQADGEVEKGSKRKKSKSKDTGDDAQAAAIDESIQAPETHEPKKKKSKKEHKSKRKENETAATEKADSAERKEKKDKKAKKSKEGRKDTDQAVLPDTIEQEATVNGEDIPDDNAIHQSGSNSRFIVFIGQLPFTATVEHVAKHFEKISPSSIRLPTRREDETRNKGFAFLEFEAYDRMKTCLKLYHRTTFDDGISPPRKIKVELTAGGGGSTDQRKEKIRYKNEKLTEERRRRAQEEAQQRFQQETKEKFAEAKGHSKKGNGPRGGPRVDQQLYENASVNAGEDTANHGGMHPDRLAMLR